jgi:predicted ATP-grasp superfamily ATP-dependent carboligase
MVRGVGLRVLVHEWVTGGGLAGRPLPGSWAAEGTAMRRAIAGDFARMLGEPVQVTATLDARLPPDPGPWTIAPVAAGQHEERLHDLSRAADFTVVIAPETRGVLAALTRDLERAGTRLLGSSSEAVLLTGDKARSAARLRSLGIDTPATLSIEPRAGLPAAARYPAVLKPIDGAGSIDTYYLEDPTSLPVEARRMPAALLQPFIRGTPMSASFLIDQRGGCWPIAVGRQHMVIRGGQFSYHGGTLPADCLEALPQVEPAVTAFEGLRGFVGVDFIWDHERAHATILDINPRPTTSIVAICRLLPPGRLARAWLDACESNQQSGYLDGLVTLVHGREPLSFSTEESRVVESR